MLSTIAVAFHLFYEGYLDIRVKNLHFKLTNKQLVRARQRGELQTVSSGWSTGPNQS